MKAAMNRRKRRAKYAEMKEVWHLVSVRYAFSEFKFNFKSNEQDTSSSNGKQVAQSKHPIDEKLQA